MTPEQIDGITKARLAANIADKAQTYPTDADYLTNVCKQAGIDTLPDEAAQSYADQWAGESIAELELRLADAMAGDDAAPPTPVPDAPPIHDVLMGPDGVLIGDYDGSHLAEGQWVRKSDAPNEMLPLTFLDKLGEQNYITIQLVSAKNPALAFLTARGLAARSIHIAESFSSLIMMEKAGIIPVGTAIAIWS